MDAAILRSEALRLPERERALLADTLLASLSLTTEAVQDAWVQEADERMAEFLAGRMEAIDGDEVMASLRARFPQ
jgi:putative addiction module component (TIGR02574 family)